MHISGRPSTEFMRGRSRIRSSPDRGCHWPRSSRGDAYPLAAGELQRPWWRAISRDSPAARGFPDRVLLGEIYLPIERLVAYYGRDLCRHISHMRGPIFTLDPWLVGRRGAGRHNRPCGPFKRSEQLFGNEPVLEAYRTAITFARWPLTKKLHDQMQVVHRTF
jgi:hypothetical protein